MRTIKTSFLALLVSVSVVTLTYAQTPPSDPLFAAAFAGIQKFENELNYRNSDGSYRAQDEGWPTLSARIAPYTASDMIAVQGLGLLTAAFGYVPTLTSRDQFAQALVGNQAAFSGTDPGGTADLLHTFISGEVRGNQAMLLLNFAWYGSETDADGNRQPIVLDLGRNLGEFDINGRCMFIMQQIDGEWQVHSFFVVVGPREFLFPVP